jgi:hypothetical protein
MGAKLAGTAPDVPETSHNEGLRLALLAAERIAPFSSGPVEPLESPTELRSGDASGHSVSGAEPDADGPAHRGVVVSCGDSRSLRIEVMTGPEISPSRVNFGAALALRCCSYGSRY